MKLYSKTDCPFCWQVKIALHHLGCDYEMEEWKQPDKDFCLSLSPQGTVPILKNGADIVWDSTTIVHYLEDLSDSDKTLFPGDISARNKARQLQTYSNSIVGKGLREVIFEKRSKPENEWDMDRIHTGTQEWNKSMDWLEDKIENTASFLTAGFSIADCALIPRFSLAEKYGVAVDATHPKLNEWYQWASGNTPYKEMS